MAPYPLDFLGPLALFAFVSSITPGPNNMMLASSGLTHGMRRTVPHMLGVCLGFALMILLVGLGLGAVFTRVPWLYRVLQYGSAAYLVWLAWKIATSSGMGDGRAARKPISFFEAAGFQWVNPKAWVMAIGVVAAYTPRTHFVTNMVIATVVCGIVNLPSISIWAGFGAVMRRWLHRPLAMRCFNVGMAALLLGSLYPLFHEIAAS